MEQNAQAQGFTVIRNNPGLIITELAWRWSFGVAATGVLLAVSRQVRDAFALSAADELVLGSGDVQQKAEALARAMAGALPYMVRAAAIAIPAIAVLWIAAATLGRTAVTRGVLRASGTPAISRSRWWVMAGLHAARVFVLLILVIGYLLGTIGANAVVGPMEQPRIALAVLVFAAIFVASVVVWLLVNFVASQAPIFAMRDGRGLLDSLEDSIYFSRRNLRDLLAASSTNATLRTAWGLTITIVSIAAAALGRFFPVALPALVIAALTVVYCIVSDVMLLARLAAYTVIAAADRARVGLEVAK